MSSVTSVTIMKITRRKSSINFWCWQQSINKVFNMQTKQTYTQSR